MIYRLRVLCDLPQMDLRAGDILGYDPADPAEPYTVCRAISPDPGAVLAAYVDGALEPITVTAPSFASRGVKSSEPRVLPFRAAR